MKLVYQTKPHGIIKAPMLFDRAIFAVKALSLCPNKTILLGVSFDEKLEETIELARKTGAKFTQKPNGMTIIGNRDRASSYKILFEKEYEKLGAEAFERTSFCIDDSYTTEEVIALIIGNIIFDNQQIIKFQNPIFDLFLLDAILILRELGAKIEIENDCEILVSRESYLKGSEEINIDGDWRIGAFALALGAIGYDVSLSNMYCRYTNQKATQIVNLLRQMGMVVECNEKGILNVAGAENKQPVKIDAQAFRDVLPLVVFVATQIQGETEIYNITKEVTEGDNGALVHTIAELKRLGVSAVPKRKGTIGITGRAVFDGGVRINCYENIMISFAAILFTLCSRQSNTLDNCNILTETFPNFWKDFENVGGFSEDK